ncbi:GGDEF domain-containing protein [Blastococcus atacamensis]|uniref:GGDEF domain-containing protein n=1 Tax=Blastococcus atacamensis TaxID=2070508 RepID=UPI000CEB8F77|nr:diguanylate cyclase [Blastococcus atacamensis]
MSAQEGAGPPTVAEAAQVHLAHVFVEAVEALLCIVDADGRILLTNPALQRFTGQSAEALLGRPFWDVWVAPEDVALAEQAVRLAVESGRAHPQEGDWLTGAGERRRVTMRNTVLRDEDGVPFAVASVGLDVTDDRAREARLHKQTRTDLLTGVASRGALFDALNARLGSGGDGVGLLFCDLDRFKSVNDEYGHGMGDRVLAEAAARLSEVAGPDHLVARLGGDEFVILCQHRDEECLRRLSEGVVAHLARPYDGPEGPLVVGVSVGLGVGSPGDAADEVIARADRAMYGAKSHQRRRQPRPS